MMANISKDLKHRAGCGNKSVMPLLLQSVSLSFSATASSNTDTDKEGKKKRRKKIKPLLYKITEWILGRWSIQSHLWHFLCLFSHFNKSGRELKLKERATVMHSSKRDIVAHRQTVALSSNLLRTLHNQGAGMTLTYVYYSAVIIDQYILHLVYKGATHLNHLPLHIHTVSEAKLKWLDMITSLLIVHLKILLVCN